MKIRCAILALVITTVLVMSCKKEQPAIPMVANNPCDCATEVSAEFLIEDKLTNQFTGNYRDTIYNITDDIHRGTVRFRALEDDADYTWYLGTEVLTAQSFHRLFDNSTVGLDITVSLVVNKQPNSLCFSNDDGYDSISKTFHIYEYCDSSMLEGYFRLAEVGTNDSIDIGFDIVSYVGTSNCVGFDIYSFDGIGTNCTNPISAVSIYRTYRHWALQNQTVNCSENFYMRAWVHLDGEFELWKAPGNNGGWDSFWSPQNVKYKGRKL